MQAGACTCFNSLPAETGLDLGESFARSTATEKFQNGVIASQNIDGSDDQLKRRVCIAFRVSLPRFALRAVVRGQTKRDHLALRRHKPRKYGRL